ncbi:MAG: methyltransferase domain-containing protein [Candidatus Eremiobacteraeota bacterium]|nr:methyltransferase domain-containing protein [Candidatus Eremiobacteraeota bacterium]MCW5870444.1 methyltransferase domain-containing protein [Candidatus Eremiobacteraeota bacterium]
MISSADPIAATFEFVPLQECPLCGHPERSPAYQRSYQGLEIRWERCRACRFVFQNPKLSRASLNSIYRSSTYWNVQKMETRSGLRLGYSDYARGEAYRLRQSRWRLRQIHRFVPAGSRWLDVACATGFFVKTLVDAGMQAWGVELSEQMASYGIERYGVDIEARDFDSYTPPGPPLRALSIWGADSNFYDPVETYRHANRMLGPDGWLFFNFWDFDHLIRPLLGEFKIGLNGLYQLNRTNVHLLLEKSGFQAELVKMEWSFASLEAILSLTGRFLPLQWLGHLSLARAIFQLPTFSGFLVAARKIREA